MKRRFWKKILLRSITNIWLKLGSLALAVVIWYSLSSQGLADRTFINVPYELRNIPMHLEVIDRGIGYISVTVRGPQNLIAYLKSDNITVPIDLPDDSRTGEMTLQIHNWNVRNPYPNQISVLQISPSSINVKLEEVTKVKLPIQPYLKGAPAQGYELTKWEIFPEEVTVKGPTSILARYDKIFTEPIDLTGVNMTFNERVELSNPDQFLTIVDPLRVTVRLDIREKITERSFPEFDVMILKPEGNPDIKLTPTSVTVNLSGPHRVIASLQPSDLIVAVDCQSLEPGTHNVPVTLIQAPAEIKSFTIEPSNLEVTISKTPSDRPPEVTPDPKGSIVNK